MNRQELQKALLCEHANVGPVRLVRGDGVEIVAIQCKQCGANLGARAKKGYEGMVLPDFDRALVQAWNARGEALRRSVLEAEQAEQERQSNSWWAAYDAYLKSKAWQALRKEVIARDRQRCQLCFTAVTIATAHVHHLSYATYNLVGRSVAQECVTLCRSCHERVETAKRG